MRIDESHRHSSLAAYQHALNKGAAGEPSAQTAGRSDQVEISAEGLKRLDTAQWRVASAEREEEGLSGERVRELRESIRQGRYEIPYHQLAGKMLDFWR